jgi:hypothetical protein
MRSPAQLLSLSFVKKVTSAVATDHLRVQIDYKTYIFAALFVKCKKNIFAALYKGIT